MTTAKVLSCSLCGWTAEPCSHIGAWLERHGPVNERETAASVETTAPAPGNEREMKIITPPADPGFPALLDALADAATEDKRLGSRSSMEYLAKCRAACLAWASAAERRAERAEQERDEALVFCPNPTARALWERGVRDRQEERRRLIGRAEARASAESARAEVAAFRHFSDEFSQGGTAEEAARAMYDAVVEARAALRDLVMDLDALISDSRGVLGLHQNGDLATWDWLTEGEWLGSLAKARALSSPGAGADSEPGTDLGTEE